MGKGKASMGTLRAGEGSEMNCHHEDLSSPEIEEVSGCREVKCTLPATRYPVDPYDYLTGSPILQPVEYCLMHYSSRLLSGIFSIKRRLLNLEEAHSELSNDVLRLEADGSARECGMKSQEVG